MFESTTLVLVLSDGNVQFLPCSLTRGPTVSTWPPTVPQTPPRPQALRGRWQPIRLIDLLVSIDKDLVSHRLSLFSPAAQNF